MLRMSEVKWIKLNVDMFDNKKIKYIRTLPEGNNIVLIWVMLLTMAGRCNASGMIFLTENIPYTADMLSSELGFDSSVIQLAIKVLSNLGMVSVEDDKFLITSWEKHQNVEGMERVRESKRLAQARWRAKNKAEVKQISTVDSTVDSTRASVDHADKEKDKDIKNKKSKYGTYSHVLLTDAEYQKLKDEHSNADEIIQFLDDYIEEKGTKYKSCYMAINRWVINAVEERKRKASGKPPWVKQQVTPSFMKEEPVATENEPLNDDELAELQAMLNRT